VRTPYLNSAEICRRRCVEGKEREAVRGGYTWTWAREGQHGCVRIRSPMVEASIRPASPRPSRSMAAEIAMRSDHLPGAVTYSGRCGLMVDWEDGLVGLMVWGRRPGGRRLLPAVAVLRFLRR
jgi:hypothetical protein